MLEQGTDSPLALCERVRVRVAAQGLFPRAQLPFTPSLAFSCGGRSGWGGLHPITCGEAPFLTLSCPPRGGSRFRRRLRDGKNYSHRLDEFLRMPTTAVKKTISLPRELAREAEETARAEGKTLSAVIQDALRLARAVRLKRELKAVQGYWSQKAREKGILTEEDLRRYLRQPAPGRSNWT